MALGLLQLCLTLLLALNTQAQNSTNARLRRPSMKKAPLQPNFQDDKFQGEWKAMGWAQNTIVSESISDVNMVSTTFELNDDHSYNVTSIWFSKQGCIPYLATFIPRNVPGEYFMDNVKDYKGLRNFTMKVVETDYNEYAVVFYKAIVKTKVYKECLLYGKNWKISPDLMSYFFDLAISMGFRPGFINFTVPRIGCNIDYVE